MSTAAERPEPFGLAEPVRLRLVQVAADVLGRLPADQVPASLRAIARFTPGKRQRLGAAAIAGALDTDAGFRAAVADAIAAVTAHVVTGLREGHALHATDPLDAAAVAYLTRPDGWELAVAEATARWEAEHAPREAASGELARLRADLADLRAQLKAAEIRAKQAEAKLGEQPDPSAATAQVTRLTKELRQRTGELRSAERERDAARLDLDAARAEAEVERQAHAAQLQMLTARAEQAQRAAEAGRRAARTDRDLDDARLRVLLDTLSGAAAGLRRELSLPASAFRPADAVAAHLSPAGSSRGADDAAGLERLLAAPHAHLIVDGYNVTKTGYPELPLADQRTRLLAGLAAWSARSGVETTVAFDGSVRPPTPTRAPRGVRVLFSAELEIADDLIRRLVGAEPAGRPVLVVTSDEAVITDVRAAGALTAPATALLALLA